MNSLEKFKKHINEPVDVQVGEDTFKIKPINFRQFGKLLIISKRLNLQPGENVDMNKLEKEDLDVMLDLFKDVIRTSADKDVDEDTIENFVLNNFDVVSNCLEKIMPKFTADEGKRDEMERKIQQIKSGINQSPTA